MPPSLHRSNLAVATPVVTIEKTHFILIVRLRERRKPTGQREREREREGGEGCMREGKTERRDRARVKERGRRENKKPNKSCYSRLLLIKSSM